MPISDRTRDRVGLRKRGDEEQLASALGVQSSAMIVEDKLQLSKAEQDLIQSRALTTEDDPWNQLPNERRTNLIKHTYDPVVLVGLTLQNNTLGQCLDAYETNIDGTGFEIERKDNETPEDEEEDENVKPIKDFFNSIYINESFTVIRRRVRRDRHATGNGYMEVIRNQAGEITLVNHLDAKLVRMVKLDEPVEVEKTVIRNGKEQKIRILTRERRYAMMIGNKVRYFREFGSSREINADTGEWLGPARQSPGPQFNAPKLAPEGKFNISNDQDKVPKDGEQPNGPPANASRDPAIAGEGEKPDEMITDSPDELEEQRKKKKLPPQFAKADEPSDFPPKPVPVFHTGPRPEDDPTKRPAYEQQGNAPLGTEVIQFKDRPDITTPYGIPLWINQIPSVLGSRKAEELNLEYFNHGGLPPVMIFLQGGQLSPGAKTQLNTYLSGQAKTKMRAVVCDVYATGGDLTSNSQVKVNVERFGGDRLADSMFEGYDERCSGRVRSSFRLPPLFTGDTEDYTFATAYASYVVAEAQVFKPERELFDETINNTIMREIAPDYVYRSLPLTVHDVTVQLQAMTLAKDVTDRKTFVDELNEIAGLNLTFQDPMTDPMNPMAMMGAGLPGQENPFAGDEEDPEAKGKAPPFGQKPNPFASKTKMPTPVGGPKKPAPKPMKPAPSTFAKADREMVAKLGDEVFTKLADDWAAHLAGDRQFEPATVNFMQSVIGAFNAPTRKLFSAYIGLKLAPGAQYDPDGVSDLLACAGDCLNH